MPIVELYLVHTSPPLRQRRRDPSLTCYTCYTFTPTPRSRFYPTCSETLEAALCTLRFPFILAALVLACAVSVLVW